MFGWFLSSSGEVYQVLERNLTKVTNGTLVFHAPTMTVGSLNADSSVTPIKRSMKVDDPRYYAVYKGKFYTLNKKQRKVGNEWKWVLDSHGTILLVSGTCTPIWDKVLYLIEA